MKLARQWFLKPLLGCNVSTVPIHLPDLPSANGSADDSVQHGQNHEGETKIQQLDRHLFQTEDIKRIYPVGVPIWLWAQCPNDALQKSINWENVFNARFPCVLSGSGAMQLYRQRNFSCWWSDIVGFKFFLPWRSIIST